MHKTPPAGRADGICRAAGTPAALPSQPGPAGARGPRLSGANCSGLRARRQVAHRVHGLAPRHAAEADLEVEVRRLRRARVARVADHVALADHVAHARVEARLVRVTSEHGEVAQARVLAV